MLSSGAFRVICCIIFLLALLYLPSLLSGTRDALLSLFKLVLNTIITISYAISLILFKFTAQMLVLLFQGSKLLGLLFNGLLNQCANCVKSFIGYLSELAMEAARSIGVATIEFLKEAGAKSAEVLSSALGDMMEKIKEGIEGSIEIVPEICQSLLEMVQKIVTDLWKNYEEAVRYVTEKG